METLASTSTDETSEASGGVDQPDEEQPENQNVNVVDSSIAAPPGGAPKEEAAFRAAGALMFPGLDRGRNLWDEDNFQSSKVFKTVPVPLGGFFTNGVAGEGSRKVIIYEFTTRGSARRPGFGAVCSGACGKGLVCERHVLDKQSFKKKKITNTELEYTRYSSRLKPILTPGR